MFEVYKRVYGQTGKTMGEAIKNQSDMIMDYTFDRDDNYKKCFINGKEYEAKFIKIFDYTINADQIEYYLQFKSHIHPEKEYDGDLGQYVDIPDEDGQLERWMIVGKNDSTKFVKYNILKCNWNLKWVYEGKIYEQLGILRTRNSYNSGIWTDYLTTTPESQNMILVPLNENTANINYNQRFLISDPRAVPIAWEVSKLESTAIKGINRITFKQVEFNPIKDNKDLMLADYYSSAITPSDNKYKPTNIKIETNNPILKIGGKERTFTALFYGSDGQILNDIETVWFYEGIDATNLEVKKDKNVIKIKVKKNYELAGKVLILTASNIQGDIKCNLEIEVKGL